MIRLATRWDVPQILAIYRPFVEQTAITFEYEPPDPAAFLTRFVDVTSRCAWLVCEQNRRILGYAYADRAFERAAYSWAADFSVYLAPEAQRKGIGTELYNVLARMVQAQGYQLIYGLVTGENEGSCRFHEKLGYQRIAELPQVGFKLGRWHSVIWYEKRLCQPCRPERMPTAAPDMDWQGIEGLCL